MSAVQLSLLSDKPEPIPFPRKRKPQPIPQLIKVCTTKQAAILLEVSSSTLYRARQAGQTYQKNGWTAKAIGTNRWQLTL